MRQHALSVLFTLVLLGSGAAYGGTIDSTWSKGNGDWNRASNWTPNSVPNNGGGNTYNVTISSYSAVLNTSPTIGSMNLSGGASLYGDGNPHTLAITGPLTVANGFAFLSFTTVNAGANSTNAGEFEAENLSINGNLTNTSFVSIVGALNVTGTLTNQSLSPSGPCATLPVSPGGCAVVSFSGNVGTLVNSGYANLGNVNLGNPINSVASGSTLQVLGTVTSGSNSGLAGLTNIGGNLILANGQSNTITPNGGTLTDSGNFAVGYASTSTNGVLPPTQSSANATINGTLSIVSGGIAKTYSGSTLAASTIAIAPGGTLYSAGGTAQGTVVNNGGIVLGDAPGDLTVNGDYTQSSSGMLTLLIDGTSTPDYSQFFIENGTATFDGLIDFDFLDGFAPTAGETFDLIQARTRGSFDLSGVTLEVSGLQPGFEYSLTNGDLTALNNGVSSSAPEPATAPLAGLAMGVLWMAAWRRTKRQKRNIDAASFNVSQAPRYAHNRRSQKRIGSKNGGTDED